MATYYVRPAGAHANSEDGLTYETAWLGWTNVSWGAGAGSVSGGDTLYLCGTHAFTAANMNIGNSGATDGNETAIRGDYTGDPGSATFTTSGFVNWSRSHFKMINVSITQNAATSCVFMSAVDNSEFNGVDMDGGDYGINMTGANGSTHSNLTVTDCGFTNQNDTGIRFLASGTNFTTTLDTISITKNSFDTITNDGISLRFESDQNAASKMSSITVDNNSFTGVGRNTIKISDEVTTGTPTSEDCLITNNALTTNGTGTTGGGIYLQGFGDSGGDNTGNLRIENNRIINQTGNVGPIDVFYNKGLIIQKNYIRNAICAAGGVDANGILVDYGNTNTIVRRNEIDTCLGLSGSAATHNSGAAIMVLYSNSGLEVFGNKATNTKHGFYLGSEASGAIAGKINNNTFENIIDNGCLIALNNVNPENVEFKNNILTEKAGESATRVNDISGAVGDLDEDYNIFYSFTNASVNHADGTNDITTDPDLESNGAPSQTSPAIGAGLKWWTSALGLGNRESFTGEPYSDFDTDIGCTQTTFGPFDPKNL